MLRKFLTGWTKVSTATSAVKDIVAEMTFRRRAPRQPERLVQTIGPERNACDAGDDRRHPPRVARASRPKSANSSWRRRSKFFRHRLSRRHDRSDRRCRRHVEAEPALLLPPQGGHTRDADAAAARHMAGALARAGRRRRSDDGVAELHPPQARDGARLPAREPAVRQRDSARRAARSCRCWRAI